MYKLQLYSAILKIELQIAQLYTIIHGMEGLVNMKNIDGQLARAASRLKEVREGTGLTQKEFAEVLNTNSTTYCRYESGDIKRMPASIIQAIASRYSVNPAWLAGFENVEKYDITEEHHKGLKRLPVIGQIAAGTPILAQEHVVGWEFVPETFGADFCLTVKGDSMINARILDGDLVYIRQQPEVENGEIAAVLIDGEEATLKRVYRVNGNVILHPENPNYKDILFSKKDMKQVSIIGKAIWFKSEVR